MSMESDKGNKPMYVPSYQIHNVLKVYGKQVSQSRIIDRQKSTGTQQSVDKISISAEGKRKMVIDKVAAGIVDRITQFGPQDQIDHEIVSHLEGEVGHSIDFNTGNDFVFNVIDDENNKKMETLSMEGSNFLTERLEQIAKAAIDKNMEK